MGAIVRISQEHSIVDGLFNYLIGRMEFNKNYDAVLIKGGINPLTIITPYSARENKVSGFEF